MINAADFIDPSTRTIKVRGVVPNPNRLLKAEMLATARFQRSLSSGVVVPAAAVLLRGEKHIVFVQVQPGVFEPRDVLLGYQGASEVVVSRGLEVGEQVVSDNVLLLARQYRVSTEAAKASDSSQAQPAEPVAPSISARPASESATQSAVPGPSAPAASGGSNGRATPGAGGDGSATPGAGSSGSAMPGAGGNGSATRGGASAGGSADMQPLPPRGGTTDAADVPRPRPPGAAVGGDAAGGGARP